MVKHTLGACKQINLPILYLVTCRQPYFVTICTSNIVLLIACFKFSNFTIKYRVFQKELYNFESL